MFKDTATKPARPTAAGKEAINIKPCCPSKTSSTETLLPSTPLRNSQTTVESSDDHSAYQDVLVSATLPHPDLNKALPPVPLFFQEDLTMFPLPLPTGQQQAHPKTHQVPQQLTSEQQQESDFLTLLTQLEKALQHIPYALCGRAALYVWGYRSLSVTPPEKVSIICPDGNEEILLSWAKTQGWTSVVSSLRGCSFEVPLGNGKSKEVNVKTAQRMGLTLRGLVGGPEGTSGSGGSMPMAVKGTWAEAEKKVLKTQAAVVTLPALLGMLMEGFVTEVDPQSSYHQRQDPEADQQSSSRKRVEEAATIILWVLSRLVERGERLSQDQVPEAFLVPFLAGWPEAHGLFDELGVSTFDSCFEAIESDQLMRSRPESKLPLDAVTLAALEGVPPPVPMRNPGRMTMEVMMVQPTRTASPAASYKSQDTIALIENEIEAWNCLSLEEAAFAAAAETPTDERQASGSFETSSQVSEVSRVDSNPWASTGSSSTAPSTVSTVSSSQSASRPGERRIKCSPPPWNPAWDSRLQSKLVEYPDWI
ncbi:hypothetical protein B0T20DRAFT_31854 [Sordaria brevicollis]|uniref:Uncharacterized protein n=1 Tax=Sordaria brevicollis TaxID=83679 RepID=A0AAE0P8I7_SORBR|nr:hypothetical protein B0T20DRAFT_31854 [Sordaria brevicollis]